MLVTLKKIFQFSEKYKNSIIRSVILNIIHSIFDFMQLFALVIVLKGLIGSMNWSILWEAFIVMLISIIGKVGTSYVANLDQTKAAYYMCADKRIYIGDRMKYMPMGYFNSHSLGEITSVVTTTMSDIENNAVLVLTKVLNGYIHAFVIAIGMLFFDFSIGLIVIVGILLFFSANSLLQRRAHNDSKKRQIAQAKLVESTLEYIKGMMIVKSFNLGDCSNKKVDKAIEESKDKNLALEDAFIPYIALQQLILRLTSVVIMIVAVYLCVTGNMQVSYCLLMVISSFMIFSKLEAAGSTASMLRIIDVSIDKVNEIDDIPVIDTDGKEIIPNNYNIEMNHIYFSYDEKEILKDISLKIPEWTTTAIVGPSGSGKSTLCNLIARFWDVNKGDVSIGGCDVKDYKLDSLLSNISMVFQKVYLFNDTIANNIKFGKSGASKEEIINAAKRARCHDFIMRLPNQYDTIIGEAGSSLSGGEKQRISIARAMLKDAPIVILDEATSNVDPENEKYIQEAMEALTKNKTIIMIAHRLKTVRNADQIVVIDEGKMVQKGTHDELMQEEGIYMNFINVRKKAVGWKLN